VLKSIRPVSRDFEEKDFLSCGPKKIQLDAKLAAGNFQNLSHIEIDKAVSLRAAS
jgi:hypothetical protein